MSKPRAHFRKTCLFLLPVTMLVGCQSLSPTERGVVTGGSVGALAGGLISKATGNGFGPGAVIGAGLGGIAGGVTGNEIERSEARNQQRIVQATTAPPQQLPLPTPQSLNDVIELARSGASDPIIINQIRTTGAQYHLSSQDIVYLKSNGVSDGVILAMQQSAARPAPAPNRTVIIERRNPVYVVPAPRPRYGIGFSYNYHKHRRCW